METWRTPSQAPFTEQLPFSINKITKPVQNSNYYYFYY
jgi:hypothetical protein